LIITKNLKDMTPAQFAYFREKKGFTNNPPLKATVIPKSRCGMNGSDVVERYTFVNPVMGTTPPQYFRVTDTLPEQFSGFNKGEHFSNAVDANGKVIPSTEEEDAYKDAENFWENEDVIDAYNKDKAAGKTKLSLADWAASDKGKSVLAGLGLFFRSLFGRDTVAADTTPKAGYKKPEDEECTTCIWGMKPLTFALVASGVGVALIAVIVIIAMSGKKAVEEAKAAGLSTVKI
jgi:hypothetical protein